MAAQKKEPLVPPYHEDYTAEGRQQAKPATSQSHIIPAFQLISSRILVVRDNNNEKESLILQYPDIQATAPTTNC